jgi:putative holliday junction resolvase
MPEVILGIDYGQTNIGLALGVNGLVAPMKIVSGKNTRVAIDEIVRTTHDNHISRFVMGLPLNADGKETKQSLATRKFAKLLRTFSKKPLDFQNEAYTTEETAEELMDTEIPQKKRRVKDHYSAALILKRYYNEFTSH